MRALLMLFLLSAAATAQLTDADPQVRSVCAAVASAPLPADIAGLPTPKTYPTCGSYVLYGKKDYAAARACAIQERVALLARIAGSPSAPPAPGSNGSEPVPAGGLVVLSELYANGEGVAQNPALAARFFCEAIDTGEVGHDDSENSHILGTLNQLEALTPNSPRIAFCVDALQPPVGTPWTRGCYAEAEETHEEIHAGGIQAGVEAAVEAADDADAALAPVLAKFTPAQRTAYDRASAAMQRFIDAQVTGDTIYMGGLYPDYYHAAFENQVVDYVTRRPAAPAPADAAQADAALNEVYRKLMDAAAQAATVAGAISTDQKLRAEQRAWLAWRDAMVALGRTLDPRLPASAWWLPLTLQRSEDLSQVYNVDGERWIDDERSQRQWQAQREANEDARLAQRRAQIAPFLDRQTPAQAAAWQRVQSALRALSAAHNAAVPGSAASFANWQLENMYSDLYVLQYNSQHGFMPTDPAKAQAGFAANDQRLNAAYQAALASPCLTQPAPGDPAGLHRTAETLRAEERAWLVFRDAWVGFLSEFYPGESRAALSNLITAARTFDLETLVRVCAESPQPPQQH